jgi:hypothetical protein
MFGKETYYLRIIAVLLGGIILVTSRSTVAQNQGAQPLRPLSVTGISPTSGPIGTSVTITGAGFGSSPGKVGFDGVPATITAWSNTAIVVIAPSGASTGPVKVCTASGQCVIAGKFTVTPSITSLDPPEGPIGTEVTITGAAFGAAQGTSTVTLNGQPVIPTSWSDTEITWAVPSGASTGPVVVTVGGYASNGVVYTVIN